MDKNEMKKQLIIDAQKVLSAHRFHLFELELTELLLVDPPVRNWQVRSLEIFYKVLDCDDLTKRLFRVFTSHWRNDNLDVVFLQSAYLIFDSTGFKRILDNMVKFTANTYRGGHRRRNFGGGILKIVAERENLHRAECLNSGVAFPSRFYESFKFWFEMYMEISSSKFMDLRGLIKEYKIKGLPLSKNEIHRLHEKALMIFTIPQYKKFYSKLLNYCTRGNVEFPASNPTDLVAPEDQNISVPKHQTPTNPTQDSTTTAIVKGDTVIPISHNSPVTLLNPSTVCLGTSPAVLDNSSNDNPEPDSTIIFSHGNRIPKLSAPVNPIRHNYHAQCTDNSTLESILGGLEYTLQNFRIPEQPNQVSVVPVKNNDPVRRTSISDNLYGNNYPILDNLCSGYPYTVPNTPVEPSSYFELYPPTSTAVPSIPPVYQILDSADPLKPSNLNNATRTNNQLSSSMTPIESRNASMEVPVSVPNSSFETSFRIPLGPKNDPFQGTSIPGNLYGINYPVLDYGTSGNQYKIFMTQVEPPSYFELYLPTSTSSYVNNATTTNNQQLSCPLTPIESTHESVEVPIRDQRDDSGS